MNSSQSRLSAGCLCCGSADLIKEQTLISPYLAFKAMATGPSECQLCVCRACGFRFYDRGLIDEETSSYYRGYRNEKYYIDRNGFEPFYTRSVHDRLSDHMCSAKRRDSFGAAISTAGVATPLDLVIDYGGGDGSLIADLPAARKISFDPSGTEGWTGIEVVERREALPSGEADLVVCAQVLEHVSNPQGLLDDMVSLLRSGGVLYLEVPDQLWRRWSSLRPSKAFVTWLCRHPRALLAADTYSTAFRVKLGALPPFGFVPMREHINFYSAMALRAFVERGALDVRREGRTDDRSFYIVAEKNTLFEG